MRAAMGPGSAGARLTSANAPTHMHWGLTRKPTVPHNLLAASARTGVTGRWPLAPPPPAAWRGSRQTWPGAPSGKGTPRAKTVKVVGGSNCGRRRDHGGCANDATDRREPLLQGGDKHVDVHHLHNQKSAPQEQPTQIRAVNNGPSLPCTRLLTWGGW